ncbi:MAG: DNA repair protein RadA [Chloroflexi bacterium]|nr:DNA repair protein RadA [Chloroflexota bacterium]MBM3174136.1 DNA repair protein RadA [Chloroflexota bacterium]MBM4449204.1 DNA repair protein RadA [Chloroflexota bacterium]
MTKPKTKSAFICQQCGKESPKWLGRCPACQEWNSLVETVVTVTARESTAWLSTEDNAPKELSGLKVERSPRLVFPMSEINRVLGGGSVLGSVALIGGDPGIGKSTLLLQVSAAVADSGDKVVYISGEESSQQLKLRSERLSILGQRLYVLPETDIDIILGRLGEMAPDLVVVDSIQTVHLEELSSAPGSIGQVRECTLRLMRWAKQSSVPVFITGHVTKEGAIAGPKVLEHIVDVVLYLEGEAFSNYRILRSVKNRFGSTNEVGVFEMGGKGLAEVPNPSEVFLASHANGAIGSVVVSTLEGSRPLLVELQALTSLATFGPPRRIATGVDFSRLLLVAAVLTRRAGVNLSNQDIITNVVGGLKVNEPAADLGIALAIASSFKDLQVLPGLVAIGEIGLSGELRNVPNLERRIAEAARLGFKLCLVPKTSPKLLAVTNGVEVIKAGTVAEALHFGLVRPSRKADAVA